MKSLGPFLFLLGLSGLASLPGEEGKKTFREFEETRSPNGKHAIAWGLKDVALKQPLGEIDPQKFSHDEPQREEFFAKLDDDGMNVENYIIDRTDHGPLATLNGFHHWQLGDLKKNRSEIKVAWSEDSGSVAIIEDARFHSAAFALASVRSDRAVQRNILNEINRMVLGWLRMRFKNNADFKRDLSRLQFSYTEPKLSDALLTVRVFAEVPKGNENFSFEGELTAKMKSPKPVTPAELQLDFVSMKANGK